MAQVYDEAASRYVDVFFDDTTDHDWLDRFERRLPRDALVLDAGCGPGNFSRYFLQRGHAVVGLDVSRRMLEEAARRVPGGAWVRMDMAALGFAAGTFDGLLVAYSLLHLSTGEALRALQEFRRVLKNDGLLAVMVKIGCGCDVVPASLVDGEWCYVRWWDVDEMIMELHLRGFETVELARKPPTSEFELQHTKVMVLARAV